MEVPLKQINQTISDNGSNIHLIFKLIWLVTLSIILLSELNALEKAFYLEHLATLCILNTVGYFIGCVTPIYAASKNKVKMSIPLTVYSFGVVQFTALAGRYLYSLDVYSEKSPDVDLYIVNFFMVAAIVIGWFVYSQNSLNSERKQHTVNVLNSSRMSSTYQEQVNLATDKYNADHKKISREDVELFIKWKKGQVTLLSENNEDALETIKAIKAVIYLLNFYEFVAAGIESGDLDEDYLYATVPSIAINLVTYSQELINEYQNKDKMTWKLICNRCAIWEDKLEKEKKAQENR